MLVLIWGTLLFSVKGGAQRAINDNTGIRENCDGEYCINLSEDAITAEAGLCAVIPCSVTLPDGFTSEGSSWCKNDPPETSCDNANEVFNSEDIKNVLSGFKGRVALLENDWTENCSIIINDLTESDSGSYIYRVVGGHYGMNDTFTFTTPTTITVTVLSQKPRLDFPPLTDGEQTTLTCTAPGRCSGSSPTITWTWRGAGENDSHINSNTTTTFKTENLNNLRQRHSSGLNFTPSAEHHGTEVTCEVSFMGSITTEETVTLNVTYLKTPEITGNTTVKDGDALNLTCSVESYPPSLITWTKLYSNGTTTELQNGTEKATLVMSNMTVEHSGQYVCTAQHLNMTRTANTNITVILWHPTILNGSECAIQSESLICVCIGQGVPLPTIKWPLLENNMFCSVITTVSSFTVNSTISLPVNDHSNTTVECVSSNEMGEVKRNLIIKQKSKPEDERSQFLSLVMELQTLVAFLIGAALSAVLCCLARACRRTKEEDSKDTAETLEMLADLETCPYQLTNEGQVVEDNQTHKQEAPEGGHESGAQSSEAVGSSAPGGKPNDVDSINYSLLKDPQEATRSQETTETDYAEIKREEKEEATIGDDEKANHYMPEKEEGGEDVAL
ncbi:sialic acid-binding Ig-like lectin 5 [Diretmus argenteus]